jgi:hypothetical protein
MLQEFTLGADTMGLDSQVTFARSHSTTYRVMRKPDPLLADGAFAIYPYGVVLVN